LFREYEISELKMQPWPEWYQMFIHRLNSWDTQSNMTDDLPF
jgi:hypothetical protein